MGNNSKVLYKHSPAPWQDDATYNYSIYRVIRHNGIIIARIMSDTAGLTKLETEANASLIATAPELLVAAKLALSALADHNENDIIAADALRVAITKAELL